MNLKAGGVRIAGFCYAPLAEERVSSESIGIPLEGLRFRKRQVHAPHQP
jgi:hypothetical protein